MNVHEELREYLNQKENEIRKCKNLKCKKVTEEIDKIFKGRALKLVNNQKEKVYAICQNSYAYESFSRVCFGIEVIVISANKGIKTTSERVPMYSIISKYEECTAEEIKEFINQNTINYIEQLGLK